MPRPRPLLTRALVALVVLARIFTGVSGAHQRLLDEAQQLDAGDREATVQALPLHATSDVRPRWLPNLAALVPAGIASVVERRAVAVQAAITAAPRLARTAGAVGARAPPAAA